MIPMLNKNIKILIFVYIYEKKYLNTYCLNDAPRCVCVPEWIIIGIESQSYAESIQTTKLRSKSTRKIAKTIYTPLICSYECYLSPKANIPTNNILALLYNCHCVNDFIRFELVVPNYLYAKTNLNVLSWNLSVWIKCLILDDLINNMIVADQIKSRNSTSNAIAFTTSNQEPNWTLKRAVYQSI